MHTVSVRRGGGHQLLDVHNIPGRYMSASRVPVIGKPPPLHHHLLQHAALRDLEMFV